MPNSKYTWCCYFLHLACDLPKVFSLQDGSGNYWCLKSNKLNRGTDCPSDSVATGRHKFKVVSRDDDSSIPAGRCAIKFAFDDTFWNLESNKIASSSTQKSFYTVTHVGNNLVIFFDVSQAKYLKRDGTHVKASLSSPCSSGDCRFEVTDLTPSRDTSLPKESSGKFLKIVKLISFNRYQIR